MLLRGAGLAGGGHGDPGSLAGALAHHAGQEIVHGGSRRRILGRRRRRGGPGIKHLLAAIYRPHAVRLDAFGIGGNRGKGPRHVQQAHFRRAERQARNRRQVGLDAEPLGDADHARDADCLGELNRNRVERVGKRLAQGDLAAIAAAEVFRLPFADLDGTIDHGALGGKPFLERGEIDEQLEQRAGLPPGLDRPVELAFVVILASDHCENGTVRRHRNQRGLAHLSSLAFRRQPLGDDALRQRLELEVDGGGEPQVGCARSDQSSCLAVDHVEEIVGPGRSCFGRHAERGRLADGGIGLILRDGAAVRHGGEHDLGALARPLEVAMRRQRRWCTNQPGQHGGFARAKACARTSRNSASRQHRPRARRRRNKRC